MLNVLRDNFRELPYLRWVLIAVALSMVLYLGSLFECGGPRVGQDWAVRINGREIPTATYLNHARTIDQNYRAMLGDSYSQLRDQLRISELALQALVDREIMRQDAERLGLVVSKQALAEEIRTSPGLQDASGQFIGAQRYRELMGQRYGGVSIYERMLADDLLIRGWSDLVTAPVTVSDAELERAYRQRNDRSGVDYLLVLASEQKTDTKTTPAEEQAWYESHQDSYRRAEGRRIRYLVVDRESQLAKVDVTDEEIRSTYEANQANYAHPEQRRARHILFRLDPSASAEEKRRVQATAEQTLERLKQGAEFALVAKDLSQDPNSAQRGGDLGYFGRGDMVPEFEEAAFATPVGELAPVVETGFGLHLIEVTAARDAGVVPLEEVRADIRRTRELARAEELVRAEAERLRAEIAGGAGFAEVAGVEGLTVESRVVTRGERLGEIGASVDLTQQAFALEPGAVSPPVRVAAGLALITVDEIVPPAVAPLPEVLGQVRADLLNKRVHDAALATAKRAFERHGDLDKIAKTLGLELREQDDLAPGSYLQGTGGTSPEIERHLFGEDARVGARGVIAVPSGAMIYEITARTPFDPDSFQQAKPSLREELLAERQDRYRQAIIDHLRSQQQVEVNQEVMRRYGGNRSS